MKEIIKGLKIGIGIMLPLLLLVVLSVTVLAEPIQNTFTPHKSYSITTLPKGGYYEVVLGNSQSMTCVDLENEMGLYRGAIKQMSIDGGTGITKVTFAKDLILGDYEISLLETKLDLPVKEILTLSAEAVK